ncbi:MAG: hypothetical protein AAF513_17050, partial [Pseudomonadota bacterium]
MGYSNTTTSGSLRAALIGACVIAFVTNDLAYADVEREVIICGTKENNLERLQCYDKIARLLNSGVRIEELYDYETAAKPVFSSARSSGARIADRLEARIAQLHKLPHHRYQITLEDGQVWREIEG